jgi:hypothetical protein
MAHDFDHARNELLRLIGERPHLRTRVNASWTTFDSARQDCLISYTCNLVPSARAAIALRQFVKRGGRWLALHATNSLLEWGASGVSGAPLAGPFLETLGSSFQAHPPIATFTVEPVAPDHPLVTGIGPFEVEDELYLADVDSNTEVLLATRYGGAAPGFIRDCWSEAMHPVMYLRRFGQGAVLYLTLGHARGHWDAPHRTPFFPKVERGAWETPEYIELLRRGIAWAAHEEPALG